MKFNLHKSLSRNRIIPAASFINVESALSAAEILLKHSFDLLEITLRSPAALECIEAVRSRFPEMSVGAGSVLSAEDLESSLRSGSLFAVSPALNEEIIERARTLEIPFIPGIATPTELSRALQSVDLIKLFPAESLGGIEYLRDLTAPFAAKDFFLFPTGGITGKNFLEYLAEERVIACAMTWILERRLVDLGDFKEIEKRARGISQSLRDRFGSPEEREFKIH